MIKELSNQMWDLHDRYKKLNFESDEYYNVERGDFETVEGLLFEINLLNKAIANNEPITYEDLGFTGDEAKKIRSGEILL